MVAHGKLTTSHQITEVNSYVEVLGKTSHTVPPLSYTAVMGICWSKNWKTVNGISCRKFAEVFQEEM